jgi:hypothetical protein
MIVAQLYGGLGNQLFQYAIGRALAFRHGTTLRLDTSKFDHYRLRCYALDRFAISATRLTSVEGEQLGIAIESQSRLGKVMGRLVGRSSMPVIREKGFGFDPSALDAPAHCYLQGYWQSPKYFDSIDGLIRDEFRFREPLSGPNAVVRDEMSRSVPVAVHVRRGDYASNPTTNQYHGTCNPEYYLAAEGRLREQLGDPTLFVFSDDPDWAEHNLRFRSRTVILRHNGPERDYDDLHLMTLCQHHVIANSTFGWWGAWLCRNSAKIVIAPKNWFREAVSAADDLIPSEWIRI